MEDSGRSGRRLQTLTYLPLSTDPFLVLNYFLQTGAYKKKQGSDTHVRARNSPNSSLRTNSRQHCGTCLQSSLPLQRPKHTPVGGETADALEGAAQNRACPWARGHGCWQDPSLGLLSSICPIQGRHGQVREHTCSPPEATWGKRDCCSHITAPSWDPNAAPGNHCAL